MKGHIANGYQVTVWFKSENAIKSTYTVTHGNNATPRIFGTKTQDFTPMVLKSLVDVHLLSIGS